MAGRVPEDLDLVMDAPPDEEEELTSASDDGEYDFDVDDGEVVEFPMGKDAPPPVLIKGAGAASAGLATAAPSGDPAAPGDGVDLRMDQRAAIDLASQSIDQKGFYEILLLPRTADDKAIKRAYYKLSKEFHPDRYYRKNLGPWKGKLQAVFNRVTEAYRTLANPDARAEYDKVTSGIESTAHRAPEGEVGPTGIAVTFVPDSVRARMKTKVPVPATAAAPPRPKAVFLQNMQKDLALKILKARQHFAAGQQAMDRGSFQEAATQFQLSLAMDPRNTKAKLFMVKSQNQYRNSKAEGLWTQAQDALSAQNQKAAADFMQKAVDCKPSKGRYYNDFGKFVMANTLQQKNAVEYLKRAAEVEPNKIEYQVDLGKAYDELGMPSNALRVFERILQLDGKHALATKMVKKLK